MVNEVQDLLSEFMFFPLLLYFTVYIIVDTAQACPKVPVEVTDCTTDDKRCYEHGGGVIKPCWNICPRQDNDPTAQKCPDFCSGKQLF